MDGVPYQHVDAGALPVLDGGQWWFDYPNHVIYFPNNPQGHLVETSVLASMFEPNNVDAVTVQNLTIEEFAAPVQAAAVDPTYGNGNSTQVSSLDWIVQDSYFTLNHGMGVRVVYGMRILGSVFDTNGNFGLGGGTDPDSNLLDSGVLVEGNVVTNNNYAHVDPGYGAGGMKFGRIVGTVVKNNSVHDNGGEGIHFDVSSVFPLIDGNTVTGNQGGIQFEIGLLGAVMRNNIVRYNGARGSPSYALESGGASAGAQAYCNIVELSGSNVGENGLVVVASPRGDSGFTPADGGLYLSVGNDFHHNTEILDSAAQLSYSGYVDNDVAAQPNFFAKNTPPDYNEYHLPSVGLPRFIYGKDDGGGALPPLLTFPEYQDAGADPHGTVDDLNTVGYPSVQISSPLGQAQISSPTAVSVTASDPSGISRVDFYLDWTLMGTATSAPFAFTLTNGSQGSHVLAAKAYSNAGIGACYAVDLDFLVSLSGTTSTAGTSSSATATSGTGTSGASGTGTTGIGTSSGSATSVGATMGTSGQSSSIGSSSSTSSASTSTGVGGSSGAAGAVGSTSGGADAGQPSAGPSGCGCGASSSPSGWLVWGVVALALRRSRSVKDAASE